MLEYFPRLPGTPPSIINMPISLNLKKGQLSGGLLYRKRFLVGFPAKPGWVSQKSWFDFCSHLSYTQWTQGSDRFLGLSPHIYNDSGDESQLLLVIQVLQVKSPQHHLVGDFCGLCHRNLYALDFPGKPQLQIYLCLPSHGFWFLVYKIWSSCYRWACECEVILVNDFPWMASKMTLSSTKLCTKWVILLQWYSAVTRWFC